MSVRADKLMKGSDAAVPLVRLWLFAVAFTVFCMVIVGGATRLTDSGLSITQWQPILGAIPPLSAADWQAAFADYQQIPEYKLINRGMSLAEFKFIYWWEWAHRFLGRFIGILFLLPFIWFAWRGAIEKRLQPWLAGLFVLGGLQGALGWYMVKSGLVDRVDVSQYRLAAHLTLATVIFAALIWVALGVGQIRRLAARAAWPVWGIIALVILQIAAGGFVAGLDAGQGYNTWPLMDGALIPDGLGIMQPLWRNYFENALTVQFQHRMLAYLLVVAIAVYAWHRRFEPTAVWMLVAIIAQMLIGIATLLAQVPLSLALVHQGGALVLLACALWHLDRLSQKTPATSA